MRNKLALIACALLLSAGCTADTPTEVPPITQESVATTTTPPATTTTPPATTTTTPATTTTTAATTTTTVATTTTTAATTTTTAATTATTTTAAATTTTSKPADEPVEQPTDMMGQYEQKLEKLEQQFEKISAIKTAPCIYITTKDNARVLSKEEYVEAVVDVFNCDEQYRLTAVGGVRVRGNSTAEGSEKPYRIKFDKKQSMLGLHDGEKFKSWVLLRSQWNLVPDYMGFSLAETIFDGEYYSSDSTFVNLYMNGKWLGIYLLCEQNQATEGRVEVYEPAEGETRTDIGYFIEMDNYAGEEDPYFTLDYDGIEFTDYAGTTKVFPVDDYSIKSDTTSQAQRDFIAKYLDGAFTIMYEAVENGTPMRFDEEYNVVPAAEGTSPKQAVETVIDLDSLVNTMILQELVHNYDVGAGSFFMTVDFSESSQYERLTFCAPWDFNWAYSEETHGRYYAGAFQKPVHDMYERSNVWLTVIMKAEWFREMLSEKWAELGNGARLTETCAQVLKTAQSLENDLDRYSYRINDARNIVQFVRGRIDWLNQQWSDNG